jgi:hypothetical protein
MSPAKGASHTLHHSQRRRAAGANTVKDRLTTGRVRAVSENDEYAAFTRRILRAYARRVATGDIESLTRMTHLADDVESAIRNAVIGLREFGYSWAEIGSRLGVSRQAAQQRWGGHDT